MKNIPPKVELSEESKKFSDNFLREEGDRRRIEFAKTWFNEHKGELEERGIFVDVPEERQIGIALEMGALEDLKRDEKYRKDYEQIENIDALRFELQREHLPIENQLLILNLLEKKIKKIRADVRKKRAKPGAVEEGYRLFQAQVELAQNIVGEGLPEKIEKELSKEMSGKGWVERVLTEAKFWEKSERVRKKMEEEISRIASSPETAVGGIEQVYGKVKGRLLAEWVERDLKKEPKTKTQLETIEREFSQRGTKTREFMADVLSRRGPLSELTGNLENDEKNLLQFF